MDFNPRSEATVTIPSESVTVNSGEFRAPTAFLRFPKPAAEARLASQMGRHGAVIAQAIRAGIHPAAATGG